MTAFTAPRGQVRAVLASLLPHTGRETDDTPDFGRVRFLPGATELLAWTTDGITSAVAIAEVMDQLDGEADGWDLPLEAVRAVLAVFRGPSDPDARMMWDDQPLRVALTTEHVIFTEVGPILDGRSLTVRRIHPAGADNYPDVPREIVTAQRGKRSKTPTTRVDMTRLARFTPSAKAWGGRADLTVVDDPPTILIRIGKRLVGTCPTSVVSNQDRLDILPTEQAWTDRLTPLLRPIPVTVPAETIAQLKAEAEAVIRAAGNDGKVTLTVVKGGEDRG